MLHKYVASAPDVEQHHLWHKFRLTKHIQQVPLVSTTQIWTIGLWTWSSIQLRSKHIVTDKNRYGKCSKVWQIGVFIRLWHILIFFVITAEEVILKISWYWSASFMFFIFVFLFGSILSYRFHGDIDDGIGRSDWVSLSPFEPSPLHWKHKSLWHCKFSLPHSPAQIFLNSRAQNRNQRSEIHWAQHLQVLACRSPSSG